VSKDYFFLLETFHRRINHVFNNVSFVSIEFASRRFSVMAHFRISGGDDSAFGNFSFYPRPVRLNSIKEGGYYAY